MGHSSTELHQYCTALECPTVLAGHEHSIWIGANNDLAEHCASKSFRP